MNKQNKEKLNLIYAMWLLIFGMWLLISSCMALGLEILNIYPYFMNLFAYSSIFSFLILVPLVLMRKK